MSIKDYNVEVSAIKQAGQLAEPLAIEKPFEAPQQNVVQNPLVRNKRWLGDPAPPQGDRKGRPYRSLWFCILIALVVRVWLTIHTQGFIDGDEALVGIQATHILHGQFPIYFYNQPYMGSLESYLMALVFAIAGPSVWALRAEPILLSLVLVWLTWKLAAALADTAQLPAHAKEWFMTIAALLAAIPPLYDTVLEMRTLGGYIEIFLLMQLLLLCVLKLTHRRQAGASSRELAWRWAGIGFTASLGFWVNPIIIYAILAAAIWISWDYLKLRPRPVGAGEVGMRGEDARVALPGGLWPRPVGAGVAVARGEDARVALPGGHKSALTRMALPPLASLPACIIGLTPAIIWGAANQWQNFTYLLQLGGNAPLRAEVQAHYPTRQAIFFGLTQLYTTCVGPRLVGGALPGQPSLLTFLYLPTLVLGIFCIFTTAMLIGLSFLRPHPSLLRIRRLAALPLLFGACTAIIFCTTKTAAIGLWSCNYDLAGRYATPLMLVLPFFFATIFTAVVMIEADIHEKDQQQPPDEVDEDNPHTHRLSSLVTPGLQSQRAMLGILVGVLLLSLYMQVTSYGLTDSGSTFQSPYCTLAPANTDPLISYMQREHIHFAWANGFLAYPILFKTHEGIILSDPVPILRSNPMLNRIPSNTDAVLHADHASFLVFVRHTDQYPQLLHVFDAMQVTFFAARFPSQEGQDVLVVTPVSRTVSPFDLAASYSLFFCSRDS